MMGIGPAWCPMLDRGTEVQMGERKRGSAERILGKSETLPRYPPIHVSHPRFSSRATLRRHVVPRRRCLFPLGKLYIQYIYTDKTHVCVYI
jgi:hypothetical protein